MYPVHIKGAVTAWTSPPFLLAEAKVHLAIASGDTSRDAELATFIETAIAAVEAAADICVRPTVWTATVPQFADRIRLEKRPYLAFTRVDWIETGTGEIATVPGATYHVQRARQHMAEVVLGRDADWPDDLAERDDAVQLVYSAGFANAAAVPAEIVSAILMMVAKLDATRGDCSCGDSGGGTVYAMKNTRPSALPELAMMQLAPWVRMQALFA